MFSKTVPQILVGKNVCELGSDGNPGAANVFMKCGKRIGFLCLLLDMSKGFLPVFLGTFFLDTKNLLFGLVIAAPVLGHAFGVFNRMHGGKCISTSFGALIGLMPVSRIGFLLAVLYILFSTVIRLRPHSLRSIITFGLFGVGSLVILSIFGKYSSALGCALISVTAIVKHLKIFDKLNKEIKEEVSCLEEVR